MPWGSKPGDPMLKTWQHDVFHAVGTNGICRERRERHAKQTFAGVARLFE